MVVKDALHSKFVASFYTKHSSIKTPAGMGKRAFETEVPYNHFGERGIVDFVDYWQHRFSNPDRDLLSLCELKTKLVDIGETIRQVKKAKSYFPLGFNGKIGELNFKDRQCRTIVSSYLIILFTKQNVKEYITHKATFDSAGVTPLFWNLEENKRIFFQRFFSCIKQKEKRQNDY